MGLLNINSTKGFSNSHIYALWKQKQKNNYFIINNDIVDYLPLIKTPALNLYLFFASKSKNETGQSTWSNSSIANQLGVSNKTIVNWISTLQDAGLILRFTRKNTSSITQLLPLNDFDIQIKDHSQITNFFDAIDNYGYNVFNNQIIILQNEVYVQFKKMYGNPPKKTVTRNIIIHFKYTDEYQINDSNADLIWSNKITNNDLKSRTNNSLIIALNPNGNLIQKWKKENPKIDNIKLVTELFDDLSGNTDSVEQFKVEYKKFFIDSIEFN